MKEVCVSKGCHLYVINMSASLFGSQDFTTQGTNTRREGLSLVVNVFMVASVETLSMLCTLNNPLQSNSNIIMDLKV